LLTGRLEARPLSRSLGDVRVILYVNVNLEACRVATTA
jgi:hypothetical protein